MPRIIVNEFDNTAAVGTEYENFTVVVPGVCKFKADKNNVLVPDEKGECSRVDGFDENGLCLLKALADFDTYVQDPDKPQIITPAAEQGEESEYVDVENLIYNDYKAVLRGNRIAKKLLQLGYQVYFLDIGLDTLNNTAWGTMVELLIAHFGNRLKIKASMILDIL